ncbi:hypothetical protein PGT21_005510 [Puccinia graminis f. sp. tritici]|uniref:Uncharacterized protein n=1 Tax=Puccinia graminis f. sp. tritici TaxID=56615 RepID=A0A5B0N2Q7_PUCGR|nr:hypothetical protein PGTUg99_035630 [Puccinia graminis f. sp. tritici]KAA1093993.1 hypothetical protein PGT21_005510 [Puccinia graminis f. sp. tritici]
MTPPGKCSDEPVQRLAGRPCPRAARTNPCEDSSDRPVQPALALPHRSDNDNLRSGRLLSDLLPSSSSSSLADRSGLEDNRLKHPFPSELADELDPTLLSQLSLSPAIGPAEQLDPPAIFVAVECPERAASWQILPDLFGLTSHSKDGLSESTSLSSLQEPPTTPVISHTAPLIRWSCKLRKSMGAEMNQCAHAECGYLN